MFTVYDVYKTASSGEYAFGVSPEKTAKELRAFADGIEKGKYLLQVIEMNSAAEKDDFHMSHLHIKFVEKLDAKTTD